MLCEWGGARSEHALLESLEMRTRSASGSLQVKRHCLVLQAQVPHEHEEAQQNREEREEGRERRPF